MGATSESIDPRWGHYYACSCDWEPGCVAGRGRAEALFSDTGGRGWLPICAEHMEIAKRTYPNDINFSLRRLPADLIAWREDRPKLLDLCCGAGGTSMGYAHAGFEVTGVDEREQPNYPFDQCCDDALSFLENFTDDPRFGPFVAIHASVPCQPWTAYRRRGGGVGDSYPELIAEVREALEATGLPYVIENVPGAPLREPVQICGSSFRLDVQRHRLFETNWPLTALPCDHDWQTPRFPAATNRKPNSRRTVEVGVWRIPLDVQRKAMGIDWMTREELSQAIPPAYTEHIGHQLMAHLNSEAKAA
jgi:DNA (cytosine-5)-methyltransferase 1